MRDVERKRKQEHRLSEEKSGEHVSTDVERRLSRKQRLIREGKRVEHVNTELRVDIYEGFTKDERDLPQSGTGGDFTVLAWIDENHKFITETVVSFDDAPEFDQIFEIPLDSLPNKYLYIELLKKSFSKKDPGTSKGTVVMGRAKIKLPPCTNRKFKVDLVGLNSDRSVDFKGYLTLSMKLLRSRAS